MKDIERLSRETVDMGAMLKQMPKYGFYKPEIKLTEKLLEESSPERGIVGKPTRWKFLQAVTAAAQDIGGDREGEIEDACGRIALEGLMNMNDN